MHIHLRVRRWVLWWFGLGAVCGVVAMVNLFSRELTRSEEHVVLLIGIAFWALGGGVCWATEAIQRRSPDWPPHDDPPPLPPHAADPTPEVLNRQWQKHAARSAVHRLHGHHL